MDFTEVRSRIPIVIWAGQNHLEAMIAKCDHHTYTLGEGAVLKKGQEDSMAKKGFWVVCYKSVSNPAAMSEYAKLAATALEASGGRVIVGAKPAKTHDAGVDEPVVVVEFESVQAAIAAYESDVYKSALKVLDNAAQRDFRIVEGR